MGDFLKKVGRQTPKQMSQSMKHRWQTFQTSFKDKNQQRKQNQNVKSTKKRRSKRQENIRGNHRLRRYMGRLDILLIVIFIAFIFLMVRLADLQIVNGDIYQQLIDKIDTNISKQSVPRGLIEDRNGELLVGNEGEQAIAYTRGPNVPGEEMAKTAQRLATMITVPTDGLTDRDRKDYFVASNQKEVIDRLSIEEKQLEDNELNEAQVNRVTDEDINFDDQQQQEATIFKKMNAAYALSQTFIKNQDVSESEIAMVSEHRAELPGVDITVDWNRTYPEGDLMRSILGGVTSESRGLPEDQAQGYLSHGYARNDRVGDAYLEQVLDPYIRGSKSRHETSINQNGEVTETKEAYSGEEGSNVRLTFDIELQKAFRDIADSYLRGRTNPENNSIYIVASKPQTGELLSLVGRRIDENGEIIDDALGTFSSSFVAGSVIKGATIAAGYHYGVLTPENNTWVDQPLDFLGTPRKASWWASSDTSPKTFNDIQALMRSSNVYMIRTAMAIGGLTEYQAGMSLGDLDPSTAEKLRYVYRQFGLGVSTGIDLPNEAEGITGQIESPGNAIDLSFGQFDTFTPLQLNQYVSTIANNGQRMAMHYLDYIEKQRLNIDDDHRQLIYQSQPEMLNQLQIPQEVIERIQQGFWSVANDPNGLAYRKLSGTAQTIAGKTGTAEIRDGVTNSTFVGYAPFDNPEIAISIVIPNIHYEEQDSAAVDLAADLFQQYFNPGADAEDE